MQTTEISKERFANIVRDLILSPEKVSGINHIGHKGSLDVGDERYLSFMKMVVESVSKIGAGNQSVAVGENGALSVSFDPEEGSGIWSHESDEAPIAVVRLKDGAIKSIYTDQKMDIIVLNEQDDSEGHTTSFPGRGREDLFLVATHEPAEIEVDEIWVQSVRDCIAEENDRMAGLENFVLSTEFECAVKTGEGDSGIRKVECEGLAVRAYFENGQLAGGELFADFPEKDWNREKDGLICGSESFLGNLKKNLVDLGMSAQAVETVSYNDQNMQSSHFVSLNVTPGFVREFAVLLDESLSVKDRQREAA